MAKKNLKMFNPDKVANLEAGVWHAYYHHQFLKLFFLLIKSLRELYSLSLSTAIRAGYHTSIVAVNFRLHRHKENREQIRRRLVKFFQILSDCSLTPLDHEKASDFEMQWWFVDRYPDRYDISREEAIALAAGAIYDVDPSQLMQYADYRAQAMVVQDVAEAEHKEADWNKIESLLKKAYRSLYENIQQ